MNIAVIGLGKLGTPLAALLASRNHKVIGLDVNETNVNLVNAGKSPVFEPGLEELMQRSQGNLSATTSYEAAISNTDISFIIVPTPSDASGKFSLRYIFAAVEEIGKVLRYKDSFHIVVITSTVMPGATVNEILPVLEEHSGKRCGTDFGLCYNPEFIAIGDIIHNMLNPDFVLIGESDRRSGEILEKIYSHLCENNPPIKRMTSVNAELTKISVNTFVTTKISYANMLGEICERLPGANVDVVTDAVGQDSRIGRKYLKGATGYGGPCFPRDNVAFSVLARGLGVDPTLAEATDTINRRQVSRLVSLLLPRLSHGSVVAILGLAYKTNTNVIEESQGIALGRELLAKGMTVILYDPLATENARQVLGEKPKYAKSVKECLQEANAIAIMTPYEEFRTIAVEDLTNNTIILDCWHLLDREKFSSACEYIALGIGANQDLSEKD